jgi:FixJ family two-component response regulator
MKAGALENVQKPVELGRCVTVVRRALSISP